MGGSLENLFREIRRHEGIKAGDYWFYPGLTTPEIEVISATYQIALPDSVISFYRQINGAILSWRSAASQTLQPIAPAFPDAVGGNFKLLDLKTVLGGPAEAPDWKDNLWFDFMDGETRASRQKLRPFDYFADESCACFVVEGGKLQEYLLLFHGEDGARPLGLNCHDYFRLLLLAKAFYGWQRAFLEPEGDAAYVLRHYLPQLFPAFDFSVFAQR